MIALVELVRDLLWARAHVLILGGWRTRPAWRFVRACAPEIPIPDDLRTLARGHYSDRAWAREMMQEPVPIRVADMDGDLHSTAPGVCSCREVCSRCGDREHYQPVYGGYMTLCEGCPTDSSCWHRPGESVD